MSPRNRFSRKPAWCRAAQNLTDASTSMDVARSSCAPQRTVDASVAQPFGRG
jgi:hypothetical protein